MEGSAPFCSNTATLYFARLGEASTPAMSLSRSLSVYASWSRMYDPLMSRWSQ